MSLLLLPRHPEKPSFPYNFRTNGKATFESSAAMVSPGNPFSFS